MGRDSLGLTLDLNPHPISCMNALIIPWHTFSVISVHRFICMCVDLLQTNLKISRKQLLVKGKY